jgi:erythromycin esterase-like protein
MKSFILIVAFILSTSAFGALPGVSEFKTTPENITDTELAALLREHVAAADVIAIGETVHGSSGLLRIQTRLIRYLVANHRLRLIVWENPALRSLELARWVASCAKAKTPVPLDVLYMPTAADLALWDWVCDYNLALTAYEASGAQGAWSLPTAGNALDKKLHEAGHTFSFFTSNAAFLSAHAKWWMQNQNFPGPYESGVEIIPRDHFDAFFFLQRSRLDKALLQRPMWRP